MMLTACREIIESVLQPLSLKGVHYEERDPGGVKARPYAVLLWGDEELQRRRRRLGHTDNLETNTRTITDQVARRSIPVQVRLVAETVAQLDGLVSAFTAGIGNLPSQYLHPTVGAIRIALRGAETPPAQAVVNREARWEGIVEFDAAVTTSRDVPLLRLASVVPDPNLNV